MKKLALLALAICFAASLTFNSSAAAAKPKLTPEEKAAQLKKYDKNGDGKLDAEEKKAMAEDLAKEKAKTPAPAAPAK